MSDFLHRTTKQFVNSGNDPDYPAVDWIRNPDLSAVEGFPAKYWEITGDVVSLMDQAERDAIDAAELEAQRDATASRLDLVEDVLRAFVLALLDERNRMADKFNALRAGIAGANNLADAKAAAAAIADEPLRSAADIKTVIRNKLGS
jgi:hypothetical protein